MNTIFDLRIIMKYTLRHYLSFFFFQAEDGIRDDLVTGVQTCALPIYRGRARVPAYDADDRQRHRQEREPGLDRREAEHLLEVERDEVPHGERRGAKRSGERRVGKEGRSRGSPYH